MTAVGETCMRDAMLLFVGVSNEFVMHAEVRKRG
jgi:hypothetical protein